jgi:hypothetical protein
MQIATLEQYRALAFVSACNQSGYRPTVSEVKAWHDEPEPKQAVTKAEPGTLADTMANLSRYVSLQLHGRRIVTQDVEHYVDHLLRLGWLVDDAGLRLTRLGEAVLVAAERVSVDEEAAVVVLESTDRFAYARLLGQIAGLGESFLVDPYFCLPQLETVVSTTKVRRVLISKQQKDSSTARAELAVALAALGDPAPMEIRATASTTLHDRIVVAENGEVYMLGGSLSTVGRANTVFMKVPEAAALALKQQAEDLWDGADPVTLPKAQSAEGE